MQSCLGLAIGGGVAGVGFFGFVFGFICAVYAVEAMGFRDTRFASSMFTIIMMFVNLGTTGG